VKCYRLPDQIGAFWWHLMFRAELTGSIRAIHLKPIVAPVSREESQVVQRCTAKSGFLIDHLPAQTSHSETSENISPKTMRAEELGRT
jgi:hypothetical protein